MLPLKYFPELLFSIILGSASHLTENHSEALEINRMFALDVWADADMGMVPYSSGAFAFRLLTKHTRASHPNNLSDGHLFMTDCGEEKRGRAI